MKANLLQSLLRRAAMWAAALYVLNLSPASGQTPTPLGCGQTVTNAITNAAQVDAYAVPVPRGQVVAVRAFGSPGLVTDLYGPGGTLLSTCSNAAGPAFCVPAAGAYTLLVHAYEYTAAGSYGLTLYCPASQPLVCSPTNAALGTLTNSGQLDCFTFAAAAGQVAVVSVGSSGYWPPALQAVADVYDPTGTYVASCTNTPTSLLSLTNTGTYTVLVHASDYATTGSYAVCLAFATGQCGLPLNCNQTIWQLMTNRSQLATYLLSGRPNEGVSLSFEYSAMAPIYAAVYDQGGRLVTSCTNRAMPVWWLGTNETWALLIQGNPYGRADYSVSLNCVKPTAIGCGSGSSGKISMPGQTNHYTFTGAANEAVYLYLEPLGIFDAVADVYDAAGTLIATCTTNYPFPLGLTSNPTIPVWLTTNESLTVLVHAADGTDTGTYSVGAICVGPNPGGCGQNYTANLALPGQTNRYTFTATAGAEAIVCACGYPPATVAEDIYDAAGALLASCTNEPSPPLALTNTGVYTVLVRATDPAATASYGAGLAFANGQCGTALRCGQTTTNAIVEPAQMDTFTIAGRAGELLAVSVTGFPLIAAAVYDPSGTLLAGCTNGPTPTLNLATTGDYTVLAHAADYLTTNKYQTSLICFGSPPEISFATNSMVEVQGSNASAPAAVSGTAPLSFQWYVTGTNGSTAAVADQTNATLNLPNVQTTLSGNQYFLVVSNAYANTTSSIVPLTVLGAPNILTDLWPPLQEAPPGVPMAFSVVVTGAPPLCYQWWLNAAPIAGATNPSYALTTSPGATGNYAVTITNVFGAATSATAGLNVSSAWPPTVTFDNGLNWTINSGGNGAPGITNDVLTLTTGLNYEVASAFYNTAEYSGGFVARFTYQATGAPSIPLGYGATFCIQNYPSGPLALGGDMYGLGYGGLPDSAALELNVYSPSPYGIGLGLGVNGAPGHFFPAGPVNLASGNPIAVALYYSRGTPAGNVLSVWLTNLTTGATYGTNYLMDLPAVVSAPTAYIGFTGSDGLMAESIQKISNFQFSYSTSPILTVAAPQGGPLTVSWPGSVATNFVLQQSPSLAGPWTHAGVVPTVVNGQNQVSATATNGAQFYRLSLQ